MSTAVLYRLPTVITVTGRPRSTTYSDVRDGRMVPPVRIGLRAVAWPAHEVDAIVRARIAGADDDNIRALVRQLVACRGGDSTTAPVPAPMADGQARYWADVRAGHRAPPKRNKHTGGVQS